VSAPITTVGEEPSMPRTVDSPVIVAAVAAESPAVSQAVPVTVPLVVKETILYADGMIDRVLTYTYNSELQLTSRISTQPVRAEALETVSYEYKGNLLASRRTVDGNGTVISLIRYEYDSQGRLIREDLLDEKQLMQTRYEFDWTSAGQRASWRVIDASGNLQARSEYLYAGDGRLEGVRLYNGAGILLEQSEYNYQAEGQLESMVYKTPQGTAVRRLVYVYANGNPVEEVLYRSVNRLERKQLSVFGEYGEELSRAVHDASGTLREKILFEYEYRVVLR